MCIAIYNSRSRLHKRNKAIIYMYGTQHADVMYEVYICVSVNGLPHTCTCIYVHVAHWIHVYVCMYMYMYMYIVHLHVHCTCLYKKGSY